MAKKTRKRSGRGSKRTSYRGKARSVKKSSKGRSYSSRGKRSARKSNSRSGRQTIRLVIEQAPTESSLDLGGKPTRKAMF